MTSRLHGVVTRHAVLALSFPSPLTTLTEALGGRLCCAPGWELLEYGLLGLCPQLAPRLPCHPDLGKVWALLLAP